jgi:hypothetical protein
MGWQCDSWSFELLPMGILLVAHTLSFLLRYFFPFLPSFAESNRNRLFATNEFSLVLVLVHSFFYFFARFGIVFPRHFEAFLLVRRGGASRPPASAEL